MSGRLSDDDVTALAANLMDQRSRLMTRSPITDDIALSVEDAYRIQSHVTANRLARGERLAGWKLGYTSLAMRTQMGIAAANFGPLTDAMLLTDGSTAGRDLIHPRVEPEIAIMFATDVDHPHSIDDVLAAASGAYACLEVVDSVFADYRFRLEDNTADGSSAAHVVLGPQLASLNDLDAVEVALVRNGVEIARANGSAASGHPVLGVIWLAEQLAATGRMIRRGDVVITGGLTAAVPLDPGDTVAATFGSNLTVTVHR